MLTDVEKHACRTARFTKGLGHGYGTPSEGYCPIGAVAVLRGAVFRFLNDQGEYSSLDVEDRDGQRWYVEGETWCIAEEAQTDVLAWTGYITLRRFLEALEAHGTTIFPPA